MLSQQTEGDKSRCLLQLQSAIGRSLVQLRFPLDGGVGMRRLRVKLPDHKELDEMIFSEAGLWVESV